jgi:enoyl-CoA hydratase/carnithine racemase/acyl-CoA-binding protein
MMIRTVIRTAQKGHSVAGGGIRWSARRLLSSVNDQFEQAVNAVPTLSEEPGDETKLKMYALYSQAKKGPCTTPAPGMFDLVGKAKHKAWLSLKDMSQDNAKEEYVRVVSGLFGGKLPGPKASSAAAARSTAGAAATSSTGHSGATPQHPGLVDSIYPRKASQTKSTKLATVDVAVRDNGVAIISLNRPAQLNAMNLQLWEDLFAAFSIVEHDKQARVIILTGCAKCFTSGMDLRVFMDTKKKLEEESCEGRRREGIVRAVKWFQDVISAPEHSSIPVLAAISGHCIGAGVDLITACDLRYATNDAAFCVKETDLGIVADVGTLQRLPKLIGDQRARELTYTARTFNGKEAEQMGLVVKSFENYEEMMRHVEDVAATIASKSPLTIRGIKKTILYTRDHSVEDSLKQVQYHNAAHMYSEDLMEAAKAIMTKEKPVFND